MVVVVVMVSAFENYIYLYSIRDDVAGRIKTTTCWAGGSEAGLGER